MQLYQLVLVALVSASEFAELKQVKESAKKTEKPVDWVKDCTKKEGFKCHFANLNGWDAGKTAKELFAKYFPKDSAVQSKAVEFEGCYWGALMARNFAVGTEKAAKIAAVRADADDKIGKLASQGVEIGKKYKSKDDARRQCMVLVFAPSTAKPSATKASKSTGTATETATASASATPTYDRDD